MIRKSLHRGFTLVELSLSMVFISLLGLAIALIITNIVSTYERGNTLNKVNTFGMDIIDDIRTAVQNSSSRSLTEDCYRYYYDSTDAFNINYNNCMTDGGYKFVSAVKYENVLIPGESAYKQIPIYGAFCTGTYTYIWNSGYFDEKDDGGNPVIQSGERVAYNGNSDFRLLKVLDDRRTICTNLFISPPSSAQNVYPSSVMGNPFDIENVEGGFSGEFTGGNPSDVTDLILSDGDNNNLAIYDLSVAPPAESGSRYNIFYAVSFILGTTGGGADILAQGKSCTAPSDFSETENFNYCAINKFSFGAQSTGAYKENQI